MARVFTYELDDGTRFTSSERIPNVKIVWPGAKWAENRKASHQRALDKIAAEIRELSLKRVKDEQ